MAKKRMYGIDNSGNDVAGMMTNNGENSGLIKADWSKACGLPMGAQSKELDQGRPSSRPGKIQDLYELVKKTSAEDAAGIKSLTKPHNW